MTLELQVQLPFLKSSRRVSFLLSGCSEINQNSWNEFGAHLANTIRRVLKKQTSEIETASILYADCHCK